MKIRFSKSLRLPFVFCAALGLVAQRVPAQSPPALSVQVSNGPVRLKITGDVGSACTIQWACNLYGANNWQFLTNLTPLSSIPYLVADTASGQRRVRLACDFSG